MSRIHFKYHFLLIAVCLAGCNFKQNKSKTKDFLDIDSFNVNKGHKLDIANWICKVKGLENVCFPSYWDLITTDKAYFFSYLGDKDSSAYFAIIKYPKDVYLIDSKRYLQEIYHQLQADTAELAQGYTVKRLIFEKKEAYYCEYYTKIGNSEYLTYSLLFEEDGFLYDFTLKVKKMNAARYYEIFQNILFNFRINDQLFFNEKDKLKKIQLIDLSSLGSSQNSV